MSSAQPLESSAATRVDTLRILTVNTHKGFTSFNRRFILPELRDAVRSVSADVVFLQEVHGTHQKHASRHANWPPTPQYEYLADSMWSDFAYGRNAVYPDGDHGNALLSKFPIAHYENHDVSISGPERRGLLHCVLAVPGRPEVHAVCVHLGLREGQRLQQMHLLCKLLDSVPADSPVIVAGDFNDWRLKADQVLAEGAGLKEAFVAEHGMPARSFPARWPMLRLDRVYVRNASSHQSQVLVNRPWSHLSDHAPLAVEVRL
ncbi:endonuclease/exonuclease/phosphatase family protein [Pseudomonas mangiferae]|uniref:Endonuclease/exonuclease/phosphatase family protein n=1 Tax=Pseudomonas mangiferae TaxID=2593654 RepID=A0A553GVK1_9PSED|nr:endonuclease/exonuclease/phosphatase family protein [Pseudomonas mangiferae]TRX73534.1 endonuclease/exonuclease/phosphatase family protein [Pseudomonas mangiferae]